MSYNPDQPRDPKGTSTGGQWTSAAGAARDAMGFKSKKKKYSKLDVSEMELNDIDYASSQFDGTAYRFLQNALQNTLDNGAVAPKILVDEDGYPYAFYQADWYPSTYMHAEDVENEEDEQWLDEPFKIEWLGSAAPGGGTAALMEATREALDGGASMLFLESTNTSYGFYEKIGMRRLASSYNHWWWSRDEMELVLEEYDRRE